MNYEWSVFLRNCRNDAMSRPTPPLPILLAFSRAFRLTPPSSPLRPQLFCHWTNCRADFLCICHPLFSSVACSVCRSISLWNWNVTNFFLRRNEEMSTRATPVRIHMASACHLTERARAPPTAEIGITTSQVITTMIYHPPLFFSKIIAFADNLARWGLHILSRADGENNYFESPLHCACLRSVSHSRSVITIHNHNQQNGGAAGLIFRKCRHTYFVFKIGWRNGDVYWK